MPGVGGAGVYIDWCIRKLPSLNYKYFLHTFEFRARKNDYTLMPAEISKKINIRVVNQSCNVKTFFKQCTLKLNQKSTSFCIDELLKDTEINCVLGLHKRCGIIEGFLIECRKIKTNAIKMANHNQRKQYKKPMRTRSK